MKEDFITYCKDYVQEHLNDYKGTFVYGSDLGYTLTEGPNADGTLTYSSYQAREYLQEWFWEAGAYFEFEKANFGEILNNPFDNPEAYMVCMVIEGVNTLVSDALNALEEKEGKDYWNSQFELTEELIDYISEHVQENTREELF